MRSSMPIANWFLWRPSSSSSACTVRMLYACSFNRRCRIFGTIERLARLVHFDGLRWKASRTISSVSASTEGLPAPFLCRTLPVYWNCSNRRLMDCQVLVLHIPGGNDTAFCWEGTAILRSSAVYVSAAPLSARQSINTNKFQRFFRIMQSVSRYLLNFCDLKWGE
jgi:hypothetical protein